MSWPPTLPPRAAVWGMLAVAVLLGFANLGSRDLVHPDEGRYAEIAREMAATGDFVTPRLNDLKYFEKPPLQYWATALAYRAFGVREWTARLWPAVAGAVAVAAVGVAGHALGGPALGALAALALAGTVYHAGMAQIVTLDAGLAAFLAIAFAAFVLAQRPGASERARRCAMWVAWAGMAGATLSKGPVGVVLPAGALVLYTAITRDYARWRALHFGTGLAIYVALTAPWFVAVSLANDEFLRFFVVHEHLDRFLTEGHARTGAWHYFVPYAAAGALPWLPVLALGARRAWRAGAPGGFSWQRFALVWAAFVFLFFSASGSKLPSYVLPMFAPLALVAAWLLLELPARTLAATTVVGAAITCVVAAGVLGGYDAFAARQAGGPQPVAILEAYGPWVKGAVAVAALGAVLAAVAFLRAPVAPAGRFWGTAALALATLVAVDLAVAGFQAFSPTRSTSAILRAAQAGAPFAPGAPVYQVAMYDQTVPYYLGRTTTLVAFRDELALGIDAEPAKQIPTIEAWLPQWMALAEGYAVLPPAEFERLAAQGVPMRVLARDPRRVVASRR